jgi:transposase-like protein
VREYSKLLWRFVGKLKPCVPGHVHVDEVFVRVNGRFRPVLQAVVLRAEYCLDISLERCRDTEAYERFFKRLKKRLGGISVGSEVPKGNQKGIIVYSNQGNMVELKIYQLVFNK